MNTTKTIIAKPHNGEYDRNKHMKQNNTLHFDKGSRTGVLNLFSPIYPLPASQYKI